jgi:hypothetical protein
MTIRKLEKKHKKNNYKNIKLKSSCFDTQCFGFFVKVFQATEEIKVSYHSLKAIYIGKCPKICKISNCGSVKNSYAFWYN